jgi:hypothetical protein
LNKRPAREASTAIVILCGRAEQSDFVRQHLKNTDAQLIEQSSDYEDAVRWGLSSYVTRTVQGIPLPSHESASAGGEAREWKLPTEDELLLAHRRDQTSGASVARVQDFQAPKPRTTSRVDTLVIGAGQAGLAISPTPMCWLDVRQPADTAMRR